MFSNPKCIYENNTLKDGLETMEEFKITNLFVIDTNKKLKGVVHIHNIIDGKVV